MQAAHWASAAPGSEAPESLAASPPPSIRVAATRSNVLEDDDDHQARMTRAIDVRGALLQYTTYTRMVCLTYSDVRYMIDRASSSVLESTTQLESITDLGADVHVF